MEANIRNLRVLFNQEVQYVIPTFQRPYVWNQDDQWEPLWNDVRNTAEEYLEQLEALGPGQQVAAEAKTGVHFLGAVVLQQQPVPTGDIETRHVIDGQQRITTLQLLLDAAQEVCEHDGFYVPARQLRKLVLNDDMYWEKDADKRFKVWPTLSDQEPFRRAMANDLTVDDVADNAIVQAHEFFKLQIREWLDEHEDLRDQRVQGLMTALLGLLQMVVIDLGLNDDANVIFETLNARGTPLLQSDLIKNSILHTAKEAGFDSEDVYRKYWQDFDTAWWRADVRQGRLIRPRIDQYLNYWLAMRTTEEVPMGDVFVRFRRYESKLDGPVTTAVTDIHATAATYREIDLLRDWSTEGTFLHRMEVMDAGALTPTVMWLFANRKSIGQPGFELAIGAIESYLVRRMICRLTTKAYTRFFLGLLSSIQAAPQADAGAVIAKSLSEQEAESLEWPSDTRVTDAFVALPLYQLLTRRRMRLLLEAFEDSLRSPKSEVEHVPRGTLSIEHLMPQGWRTNWLLPDASDLGAQSARDRAVQTIGNLTLLKQALNSEVSNLPWAEKRSKLDPFTVLQLTRTLLKEAGDQWDEDAIQERGRYLAGLACRIWPRGLGF